MIKDEKEEPDGSHLQSKTKIRNFTVKVTGITVSITELFVETFGLFGASMTRISRSQYKRFLSLLSLNSIYPGTSKTTQILISC